MIGSGTFTNIFGLVPAGDDRVARVARAAVAAGYGIVICKPGTRVPMCTLGQRAAAQADREEAERTGKDNARHPCGIDHTLTDPKRVLALFTRLEKAGLTRDGNHVNLGVHLGVSRVLVVDVDTREQRDAFLTTWTGHTGVDQSSREPTVLSPGQVDDAGTWSHKDGGHWWFTLPEGVDLPETPGVYTGPGGWVALWGRHQVLVPPSVRKEGPYRVIGQAEAIPAWLLGLIEQATEAAPDRAERAPRDGEDPIDAWAASTPWEQLLRPDGWLPSGAVDRCGCPIWSAPGDHASPKSATAHGSDCGKYDTSCGWAPLHVWTDSPPEWMVGRKTWTPLQYLATRDHAGDVGAAMSALNLHRVEDNTVLQNAVEDDVFNLSGPGDTDDAFSLTGLTRGKAQAPGADRGRTGTGRLPNLPRDFWATRPELAHIRTGALSGMCSPDALLAVVLARLASLVPHTTRLDIGLGPAGLNLIVCPVGPSSAGKGLAMDGARRLLPAPAGVRDYRDGIGIGSGEGVAEAFMGTVMEPTGGQYKTGDRKGEDKVAPVRQQVRYNILFQLDEGQTLGQMAMRNGSTIMPALRSAWSGATLGQSNARQETTRVIMAGEYATGIVLAFQPGTASAVLQDTDGLAQRALWVAATSADVTADEIAHPGRLPLDLFDPMLSETEPLALVFPADIRAGYRQRRADVVAGTAAEDPLDGHGPLVRAKLAALLCLLAGRDSPTHEDWQLGGVLWGTSVQVRAQLMDSAIAQRAQEARDRAEAQAKAALLSAQVLRTDAERHQDRAVQRVAARIANRVSKAGTDGLTRPAATRNLTSADRKLGPDAILLSIDQGKIKEGPDGRLYAP
jgi:hypothetical protein